MLNLAALAMKAMLDAAIEHALAACRKDAQKIADVALNSMSSMSS